jgi:hypothetical protein
MQTALLTPDFLPCAPLGLNLAKIPKVLSMHISITIKHILNTRVQLML